MSIGEKGGVGQVIKSTFPTLGYEYMTLTCVSTSCIDAFVGEIWPEVLLERNLATLSNQIYIQLGVLTLARWRYAAWVTCGEQTVMPKGWAAGADSGQDTAILTYTKVLLTQRLSLQTSAGFSLNATQNSATSRVWSCDRREISC